MNLYFIILFLLSFFSINAQEYNNRESLGLYYGIGNEIKNRNYTYSSHYVKLEFTTLFKEPKKIKYEVVLQAKVDFAEHQLLNLYYITPDVPHYLEKRERFGMLKSMNVYSLNLGLIVSLPLTKKLSVYALAIIGPMVTNTETERLSKGFAFSSVFAAGISFKIYNTIFEVRPNFNHLSNAGLQKLNNGINTLNVEFGLKLPL